MPQIEGERPAHGGQPYQRRDAQSPLPALEALRQSEEKYRTLFTSIDEGFCICQMLVDEDGRPRDYRFVEVNPMFEDHTGLKGACGRTALELVPDLEPHWIQIYGKVALTGEPVRFTQASDAMGRWFDVYAFRFGEPQDRMFGILFTDITARKRADEKLRRTQARLESALEAGLAGTFYWDIPNNRLITDDNMMRYFSLSERALDDGVALEEVLPAIDQEDRSKVARALSEAIERTGRYQVEYRVNHSDGRARWLSARGIVERDGGGRVIGLSGFAVDITERRQAEAAARDSEERYRAIVESQAEMICRFRPDGTIRFVNGAYARARGVTPEALTGQNFWTFVDRNDQADVRALLDSLRPDAPEVRIENRFETAEGARWTLWTNRGLAFDSQGRATEVQSSGIDITERKQIEADLRNANRMKDEFLATLSHELRTPLNAMLGWSHLLRTSPLRPEVAERAFESLERNAKAQTQLVDDLLDMSRIVSGKLEIRTALVDLGAVIASAVDTVRPGAASKGVSLHVRTAQVRVNGDADRLRQIVWNLLSNAVKFTPSDGHVDIALTQVESAAEIVVRDTGEGIGGEFLPFVFDRFRQADGTMTRRHGGLGLGLAIVRHLTEAHGGTVAADSQGHGKGTTFTIRLPAAGDAAMPSREGGAEPQPASTMLDGMRILVVDDEADARDLLRVVLELEGADVAVAATAGEALHRLQQEHFDALLADIGMPDQDGLSLIRTVRKGVGSNTQLPAIAVTAYASAKDGEAALEAGYDRHIPKPVEPALLVQAVALAVSPERGRPAP